MTALALELREVTSGYAGGSILHGVSLHVASGELVAVVGSNGSGKSVLARTISGVVPVSSGSVRLLGSDVTRASPARRVRAGLHHLSQRRGLVPDLTVAENVRLAAFASRSGATVASTVDEHPALLPWVDRPAGTLSGGEQAMVALARATVTRPSVLVADEPTAGVSPAAAAHHRATLARLCERGTAVLLIEQNVRFALRVAHRVVALRAGSIVFAERARDVTEADIVAVLSR